MGRVDDDSWDIDRSVGATALGTAAVRAFENLAEPSLFVDPFAQRFLDAADRAGYVGYGGKKPSDFAETDSGLAEFVQTMTNFTAVRTRYFDDAIAAVPIDLRHDWPTALRESGFRESTPTSWLAEGLLPYLPPAAQTGLFEHICALSAIGSQLVVDAYRPEFYAAETIRASFANMDRATRESEDDERIYSADLFFAEARAGVAEWFRDHGWNATSEDAIAAMVRLGRPPSASVDPHVLSSDFVRAELTA